MILPVSFYSEKDGIALAKALLGQVIVREEEGLIAKYKIVETEAYMGPEDKGAHTYGGKKTERTAPLFEIGGTIYVYLIYGMYHCLNISANQEGAPHCVLIRAVQPVNEDAYTLARKYRPIKSKKEEDLTNGPGKLCKALHIDRSFCGQTVTQRGPMYIEEGETPETIVEATRINIDYAEEYKDALWRFYIQDNTYVSVKVKETKV